ncbi:MAG: hypothetical protein ACXVX7_07140 [Mycobacterium sp.]
MIISSDMKLVSRTRLISSSSDLITDMQLQPDEEVPRRSAASFGRDGIKLPPLDVLRRVQILTRMGTTETVLAAVEMRILTLLSVYDSARPKTLRTPRTRCCANSSLSAATST